MIPKKELLSHYGYFVERSNLYEEYDGIRSLFASYLSEKLSEYSGKNIFLKDVGKFHEVLLSNNIDMHEFIANIEGKRILPMKIVNHDFMKKVLKRIGSLLGEKFELVDDRVYFRVCRPQHDDSNDLHRDTWFPNYKEVLNVYLPMSGSYCDSAMQIVPFSHEWTDDEIKPNMEAGGNRKYIKNGIAYSAPTVGYSKFEINPHRPDVTEGDFMVFNPRIIHGKGDNYGLETRFSFEFRLEQK